MNSTYIIIMVCYICMIVSMGATSGLFTRIPVQNSVFIQPEAAI
ncbi:hypothetical protein WAK64_04000 [Bacillus spongiae]|uniref:Uncharacterized protein n=1 Tax=Bacillus spongiae TaxID=2683610 RepID=A0ABU8HA96_9BACI